MDTREAAERWRATWERCWQSHEPEPIVALYADGAYFQTHPFRDPQRPRDYAGSTRWVLVRHYTTSSTGGVVVSVQPRRYTYYLWSYAGSAIYSPATSKAVYTTY